MRNAVNSELRDLADPECHTNPLDVRGLEPERLIGYLDSMLRIRLVEEAIAALVEAGQARAPCHLGIGQEAVAVGVSASLTPDDRVFGGHRSHSHYLALGGDVYALIAEVLGKEDGACKGMGGSMHLYAPEVGFRGSVPIVGATIPIAVGAALAAKMDGRGAVAVAYFGDGACEEGVFHESLNLAANYGLPVLFMCENNLFSSHLDIKLRQPSDRVARFGEAHRIQSVTINGNDVIAVANAANGMVAHLRAGGGPGFLEAVTYRHRGHVGPKEDLDVGVRRTLADLDAWKKRDPILALANGLIEASVLDEAGFRSRAEAIRADVAACVERAKSAGYPEPSALLSRVFAGASGE